MNTKELKEIIEMIKEAIKDIDIAEFDLEREGIKIRIKKSSAVSQTVQAAVPVHSAIPQPVPAAPAPVPAKPEVPVEPNDNLVRIISPMVGTFYVAPSPDAPPFVKEGDMISEGQTVCIIEAMKLMNEIKSEVSGKVVKILAENGQAIEFGNPLFLIEPAK